MTSFAVPSKKQGPRTTIFHNVLLLKKIQISLVRGPLSRPSSPDSSLTLRMTFLVTIDAAASCHPELSRRRSEGSEVPHWQPPGAYIKGCRGISHKGQRDIIQNVQSAEPKTTKGPCFIFYRQYEAQEVQSGFPCPYLRLSTRR